jgi:hypothetical protein
MSEATTSRPIPTDLDDLAALLRATKFTDRDGVRVRLVNQLGDEDAAWRLYGDAESLVRYEKSVTRLRAELREALSAAEKDLHRVDTVLGELAGKRAVRRRVRRERQDRRHARPAGRRRPPDTGGRRAQPLP